MRSATARSAWAAASSASAWSSSTHPPAPTARSGSRPAGHAAATPGSSRPPPAPRTARVRYAARASPSSVDSITRAARRRRRGRPGLVASRGPRRPGAGSHGRRARRAARPPPSPGGRPRPSPSRPAPCVIPAALMASASRMALSPGHAAPLPRCARPPCRDRGRRPPCARSWPGRSGRQWNCRRPVANRMPATTSTSTRTADAQLHSWTHLPLTPLVPSTSARRAPSARSRSKTAFQYSSPMPRSRPGGP